ncbi:LCP family protein [Catenulispora sp. NF23]|uniref:LCP family protein n=1 Tax=Catenulispora pinistramenti TaxID=2705254 RepID=A0ABS5KNC2_9ACTN|nr:LCP family protein [Catenulispora pinistramenti]MBS2536494.1 LCP family protein [Catenulispora pinistramenti]MBS2547558.1 LCP family protein [Catenulispora pinistramenti]
MSDWYPEDGDYRGDGGRRGGGGERWRGGDDYRGGGGGRREEPEQPWRAAQAQRRPEPPQQQRDNGGWQQQPPRARPDDPTHHGGPGDWHAAEQTSVMGQQAPDGYGDAADEYDYDDDHLESGRRGGAGGGGRRGGGRGAVDPGPGKARKRGVLAGRITAATMSAIVVLATGFVWYAHKSLTDGLHTSDSISQIKPGQDGYVAPHAGTDVNLLLIGLDSRKDMNGNDLPTSLVEDELHAGSSDIGGYNTNVLILMHIPANGGQVTAYSIPRDSDVERPGGPAAIPGVGTVQVPDMGMGKIKEAYGDAKAFADQKINASGKKPDKATEESESREVGREATIRAVQKLTGVRVDHLAEVNLVGFYDIVKQIGSIQVCLKAPAYDPIEDGAGTGINLPAGVSTIDAATALQFVRQRFHLPNGDLDRTHRQQAFLTSVMQALKKKGVLSDVGSMQGLFNVVKNDIVIDNQWDVLDFASQASNLTGGNAQFITLPTTGTVTVNGEEALTVDPNAIKNQVTSAFNNDAAVAPPPTTASSSTPPPSAPSTTPVPPATITVLNGTTTTSLALKAGGALFDDGIPVSKTGNGGNGVQHTTIRYGAGEEALAKQIQAKLGTKLAPESSSSLPKGSITVTLGYDYKLPPAKSTAPPSGQPSGGATSVPTDGSSDSSGLSSGGAVSAAGSQDGIPCVY